MRSIAFLILFITCITGVYAQNLVQNGSFEDYITCPNSFGNVTNQCRHWRSISNGTPDFVHACAFGTAWGVPENNLGYQYAADGGGYVGMLTYTGGINGREMVGTTIAPLIVGGKYQLSLSASLAKYYHAGTNGLGAYLYKNGPVTFSLGGLLPMQPKVSYASYGPVNDSIGWVRLSDYFIADSSYENLVIGGVLPDQLQTIGHPGSASYYFIDSVVLLLVPPVKIDTADIVYCAGDSIRIPYSTVGSVFNTGNVFTLQLSSPTGSFATPINIGSITATETDTIRTVLPNNLLNGTMYRLRIQGNNQVYTSADNGFNIHIKPLPTPVTTTANTPLCEGSTLNLNVTAATGSTYSWSGPSYTSTLSNPTIANATTGNSGKYMMTATLNGCIAKDSVTVLVKPKPAMPTATNNGPLCPGDTLYLFSSSTTSGVTYAWTGPVPVPQVQNPTILNVTALHTGVYSSTATLNGCSSVQGFTTVTVKPIPAVPAATSNSPVCTGGILSLFASSSTPGVSYNWTGPAGFTSNQQNPSIDPVPASSAGVYYASATLNGCTSQAGSTTTVVNTVTYLGAYASPNDTICDGDTLNVITVPINSGTNPVFQWYKNNVAIAGATMLKYTTMTAAMGDSFYCKMIAYNVCNTPITLFSSKIGIAILHNTPSPTINISSVPANPLPGNMTTFTASISNGGTSPQIQWMRNGQDIVGAVSNTWSASNLNPYDKVSARVTSSEPCPQVPTVVSNSIEINFPVNVHEVTKSGFEIYPNPNKGQFIIKGKVDGNEIKIEVVSMSGQLVYKTDIQSVNGSYIISPEKPLLPGVYLLKLIDSETCETIRFVVQ